MCSAGSVGFSAREGEGYARFTATPDVNPIAMTVTAQASTTPIWGHTKMRYSLRKTARIFGCHDDTFRDWLREGGIPLPNGDRVVIEFVPLGVRKIEFEQEEVERVYQELKARGREMLADILAFPEDEAERDERRARASARRANQSASGGNR